jgi:carbon-monoxide dehydrogenase medium subunit
LKPAVFVYHRPATVAEAVATLAGGEAKVLAGGQSLVPILNMRLAAPTALVDINRLGLELAFVSASEDRVRVGALTRHAQTDASEVAFAPYRCPPGNPPQTHQTIRNRGRQSAACPRRSRRGAAGGAGSATASRAGLGPGCRTVPRRVLVGPLESAARPDELAIAAFPGCPLPSGSAWVGGVPPGRRLRAVRGRPGRNTSTGRPADQRPPASSRSD